MVGITGDVVRSAEQEHPKDTVDEAMIGTDRVGDHTVDLSPSRSTTFQLVQLPEGAGTQRDYSDEDPEQQREPYRPLTPGEEIARIHEDGIYRYPDMTRRYQEA